ncbi:SAGA complex associated factor 29 [Phyllostomus discolor]|uniref:SAGA-associated factor 29 n=1 Tax=Phyllostomus discolor TaxID=89673 RepID=A0A834BAH9_9CHIR|nr:SAGA complex associated factor 29 [Phyllostomus discolor]
MKSDDSQFFLRNLDVKGQRGTSRKKNGARRGVVRAATELVKGKKARCSTCRESSKASALLSTGFGKHSRGKPTPALAVSSATSLFSLWIGAPYAMALVSADSRIAELLTELHQLIKQTQEERSRSEHNLVNIQKTHERMQTENKISPYYRTKLRGLYTTAKADAEAECNILRKALDKIAEIKSLLEERRIAAKIAGLYNDSEPPRKTMRRGVLMTLLQQSAMTLPLWIGKPGDKPPPLCGAIPASGDYVAKPGDKVAARVKAVDGDEQWILAEVVSYSHATNKYEVDDIDEEGKERHTLSRRRIIPLPQWKANPETDPEALFQKEQLVLALYPQTTCFYRALIHTPPQRPQDDYSVLFEDTSYADGYSPPLNVAQRYVVACKEPKKK